MMMTGKAFSLILLVCCSFIFSVAGQTENQQLLIECSATVSSMAWGSYCTPSPQTNMPFRFSIPPNVIGTVTLEVTSAVAYDTSICMMFGLVPDIQHAQYWSDGYCPSESLFVIKANKGANVSSTCPKPSSSSSSSSSSSAAASTITYSKNIFRASIPSRYSGSERSYDSLFPITPAAPVMAAATTLPSSDKPPVYFIPRTSESEDTNGYFIAAAVTDKSFIGKGRSCLSTISVRVYSQYTCPEGTVGPQCLPVAVALPTFPDTDPLITTVPAIAPGSWSYFTFINSEDLVPSIKLQSNWTFPAGPSSISGYIRWEGVPYDNNTKTTKAFDQKFVISNPKSSVVLANPRPGRYYIGFYNSPSAKASVEGKLSLTFAAACKKKNYLGNGCSTEVLLFSKMNKGSGSVTSQKPTYILFNSTDELVVSISTLAISAPTIYLGAGFVPNSTYYSIQANTGEKVNRISTGTLAQPVYWVLAVVAELQETIGFNVWTDTICYRNCSGKGYCPGGAGEMVEFNPSGECKCNATKGKTTYENFACQIENNHNFQLEYIILIAVGGAIILAIVIGVPLYCFIHRRDSRAGGYQPL